MGVAGRSGRPVRVARPEGLLNDGPMSELFEEMILFLRLAQAFRNRMQMPDRDRALVMAGAYACLQELSPLAAFCRTVVLQNNPGHMLRKWPTMREAMEDPDFATFLKQVQRRFPIEKAESMLKSFGYQCDVREGDYQDPLAFAAAVMGVDAEWLLEHFDRPSGPV